MGKETKYYKLEELKVGMRVSVKSLLKISDVCIYLDINTFVEDKFEIGFGNILYIGYEDYIKSGATPSDVYYICNQSLDYNPEDNEV